MNDSGLVDVVIPVFNGEKTIAKAIDSVLNQDSKFINNIIVIDDGSTDSTVTEVKKIGIKNLKLIRTTNNGVSSARNLGINHAEANWIAFLDADDIWESTKIKKQLDIANTKKINFVCGAVNGLSSFKSQKIDALSLARGNIIATSSVLVKREILIQNHPIFKPGITYAEDYLAWLKCLTNNSGYYSSEVVATYHFDQNEIPKYKFIHIVRNLILVNLEYLTFLIKKRTPFNKILILLFFLFWGIIRTITSTLKRFSNSKNLFKKKEIKD
jgi:glycosyltransferase involved in cell wall biosynthesis